MSIRKNGSLFSSSCYILVIVLFSSCTNAQIYSMNWVPGEGSLWWQITVYVSSYFPWGSEFSYTPGYWEVYDGASQVCCGIDGPGQNCQSGYWEYTFSSTDEADLVQGTGYILCDYPAITANYTITTIFQNNGYFYFPSLNNPDNNNIYSEIQVSVGYAKFSQTRQKVLPNKGPIITVPKIVPVISGQTTQLPINAIDPDGDAITYRLDNFGGITPPNGVSLDPHTGLLTIPGTMQNGNYFLSTSVSDGFSTGTVIFLFTVYDVQGICSNLCARSGSSCFTNSDCGSCSLVPPQTSGCLTMYNDPSLSYTLPIIESPANNEVFTFDIGEVNSVYISAYSPLEDGLSDITVSPIWACFDWDFFQQQNFPVSVWEAPMDQYTATKNLTWVPPGCSDGPHPVSVYVNDTNNYVSTFVNFIIDIPHWDCNTENSFDGAQIGLPGTCGCRYGYDPLTNCNTCPEGIGYSWCGQKYNPCIGDGLAIYNDTYYPSCVCDLSWPESNCGDTIYNLCDPTEKSSILAQASVSVNNGTESSAIFPPLTTVYLTPGDPDPLTISFEVAVPMVINVLDIVLVVDVSKSITSDRLQQLSNSIPQFVTSVEGIAVDVAFSLVTFTENPYTSASSTPNDFMYLLNLPITPVDEGGDQAIIDAIRSLTPNPSLGGDDTENTNDCQLDTLITTFWGTYWRGESVRIVVLITDSGFWSAPPLSQYDFDNILSPLIYIGAIPVVVTTQQQQSVYQQLWDFCGMGFNAPVLSPSYANWYTSAFSGIVTAATTVNPFILSDTYGFINQISPPVQVPFGSFATVDVTLQRSSKILYPVDIPSDLITILFPPIWGSTASIYVLMNHAPIATLTYFSINKTLH